MSIDLKFVELTAGVLEFFSYNGIFGLPVCGCRRRCHITLFQRRQLEFDHFGIGTLDVACSSDDSLVNIHPPRFLHH